MNFENDPIADKTAKIISQLRKDGVELKAGSEYNRVFEAVYKLISDSIEELKKENERLIEKAYHAGYDRGFNDDVYKGVHNEDTFKNITFEEFKKEENIGQNE
jgi:polysaccharide pyruvyl transferase WcaK-like protein